MQNMCNNTCGAGFIPTTANWDWNLRCRHDCGWQGCSVCGCNPCTCASAQSGCGCNDCGCDDCSNCGCNNGCTGCEVCGCNPCTCGSVRSGSTREGCKTRTRRTAERTNCEQCRHDDDDDVRTCCAEENRTVSCRQAAREQDDGCECTQTVRCGRDRDDARSCGKQDASARRRNRGVGMVYAVKQELDQIYESDSALCAGTLFPELHKPMNGYCPGECRCQTDAQAAAFVLWELRLYLNTHPCDKEALALFARLCKEADDPNYAAAFLEDGCCGGAWRWTDDPWPWECGPCGK